MVDLAEEKLLIEEAKKDPANFCKLYQLYFDKIYNFLLSRCGQVELAEDITSQTFLSAMEKIKQFKWQNVSFGAWLFRIAINNLNSHYRKNNRIILTEDENLIQIMDIKEQSDSLVTELENKERATELYQAIQKLTDYDQNLISLKYFQYQSYQEIAEILKIPVSTVGVKLHRAINKLKKIIELEI